MRTGKLILFICLLLITALSGVGAVYKYFSLKTIIPDNAFNLLLLLILVLFASALTSVVLFFISEYTRRFDIDYELEQQRKEALKKTQAEVEENKTQANVEYLDGRDAQKLVDSVSQALKNAVNIKDYKQISSVFFKEIADFFSIVQGEVYLKGVKNENTLSLVAHYAYYMPEGKITDFEIGDGLIGQVASKGVLLNLSNVPENYIKVASGLGKSTPQNLAIIPLANGNNVFGVLELASFKKFSKNDEVMMQQVADIFASHLFSIIKSENITSHEE